MTALNDRASPRKLGLSVAAWRAPAAGAQMQARVGEESARRYPHEMNCEADKRSSRTSLGGQSRNRRRAKPSGKDRELHGSGYAYQIPSPCVIGVRQASRDPYESRQSQTSQGPLESLVVYRPPVKLATINPPRKARIMLAAIARSPRRISRWSRLHGPKLTARTPAKKGRKGAATALSSTMPVRRPGSQASPRAPLGLGLAISIPGAGAARALATGRAITT
jgi:hypothetical protein